MMIYFLVVTQMRIDVMFEGASFVITQDILQSGIRN